jgi:putative transposase
LLSEAAFLSKDRTRNWLIEAIDGARCKHRNVWAYVIMPEHAYLLLWPLGAVYDISDILSSIKQSVAKRSLLYVKREAPAFLRQMEDRQPSGKTHYRFWQRGGGYDRNIIEPATAFQQFEYIHSNPVRRGLSDKPEDWIWSSAADYLGIRAGTLKIDRPSLP